MNLHDFGHGTDANILDEVQRSKLLIEFDGDVFPLFETQPSRFVRHTRRCEAEFPVPISDAGGCETKKNDSPPRGIKSRPESPKANFSPAAELEPEPATKGSPDDVCARNKHGHRPEADSRHGRHGRDHPTHYSPIRADFDPELTE